MLYKLLSKFTRELTTAKSLIALCLYIGLFDLRIILGKAHFPFDFEGYHYPLMYYMFRNLKQGQFPLWDVSSYSGMPFVNNIHAALFYPVHLFLYGVLILLNSDFSLYVMQYINIFHFFLAGVGFFFLLRDLKFPTEYSLLGSILFVSNGFFNAQAQHLGVIEIISWMPIAFLLLNRIVNTTKPIYAYLLGLVLSLMFFVGFLPEVVAFLTVFALYALFLITYQNPYRKFENIKLLMISLLFFVLITAVASLPLMEFLPYSIDLDKHGGVSLSAHLTTFIPNYFDSHKPIGYWGPYDDPTTTYFYGGLMLPLLFPLGFFQRTSGLLFFKVLFALSFSISLNPLSKYVIAPLQGLPLIGALFRPFNFLIYLIVSAIILALNALVQLKSTKYLKASVIGYISFIAALIPITYYMSGRSVYKRALPVIASLILIYVVVTMAKRNWRLLLIPIFTLEIFLFNFNKYFYHFPGHPNSYGPKHVDRTNYEIINFFQSDADIFRISVNQEKIDGNWNSGFHVWGLESTNGFDPLLNKYYLEFLKKDAITWSTNRTFHIGNLDSEALRFLNVKYYLTIGPATIDRPDFKLVMDSDYKVYCYEKFTPRYLILPPNAAHIDVASHTIKIEKLPEVSYIDRTAETNRVKVINYSTNARTMQVNSPEDGLVLFIGEVRYPGWKIFINGREAELFKVNDLFMGAIIPKGTAYVKLIFRPSSFKYGCIISTLGLIALSVLLATEWQRRVIIR